MQKIFSKRRKRVFLLNASLVRVFRLNSVDLTRCYCHMGEPEWSDCIPRCSLRSELLAHPLPLSIPLIRREVMVRHQPITLRLRREARNNDVKPSSLHQSDMRLSFPRHFHTGRYQATPQLQQIGQETSSLANLHDHACACVDHSIPSERSHR